MKKNAYFIYKRFVLNRVSGKNKPKEIELWFEDIKKFLGFELEQQRRQSTLLSIKHLTEMQQKGLIAGYSWSKNYAKQRQYRVDFDTSSKSEE